MTRSRPHRGRAAVVGVDLGATTIKAARVVADGTVEARGRVATRFEDGVEAVLARTAALVGRLAREDRREAANAVGIGACGLIDPVAGRVVLATDTTPGWAGVALADEIARRTALPCASDNDGHAAALAEARWGAGRGMRTVVALTLGTGVGGGVAIDGRVLHGAGFVAGTFGHLKVSVPGARPRACACGARGCLEAYASAWAMRRAPGGGEPREVFRRAREGDEGAQRIVDRAADALGAAFADIAHALNPDVIAIGGGIARGWRQLERRALARYIAVALPVASMSTRVVRSPLGTDAGILGAALLAPRPAS